MTPTVLLFDIDGTLLATGGVGRRALNRAFEGLHGHRGAFATLRMDGMTDRAIVRSGLAAVGLPSSDEAIEAVLERYLALLEQEVADAEPSTYRVHVGMERAVDEAHARGMAVGLGTGNVKEGARLKLERVKLFDRFAFGGFGCDHEDRVELIRRGASRGAAHLGISLQRCRVVVIGDTPKDVAAAKGIGAECIGVATGAFSCAQLLEAGAHRAFDHLAAAGALEALLCD